MKLSISRSKALVALAVAATVLSSQAQGQSATTHKKKTATRHKVVRRTTRPVVHRPAGPTTAEEIQALREQMQQQQTQISGLQQQLSASQQQVSTVQQSAADAQQQAGTAQTNAAAANQAAAQAQSDPGCDEGQRLPGSAAGVLAAGHGDRQPGRHAGGDQLADRSALQGCDHPRRSASSPSKACGASVR